MTDPGPNEKEVIEHFMKELMGVHSVGGRFWESLLLMQELRCEESINEFLAMNDEAFHECEIPDYPKKYKEGDKIPTKTCKVIYASKY